MNAGLTPATEQALDLNACDREPIHEIPMVQAYGAFVAFSFPELKVRRASENLARVMGAPSEPEGGGVGLRLGEVLDTDLVAEILGRIQANPHRNLRTAFEYRGRVALDVFLYSTGKGALAVELSPLSEARAADDHETFGAFLRDARSCATVPALGQRACEAVRQLTGFDRVMLYRFFAPSWYGEVIAEDRIAEAHSFRDHRFPASDIPKPARDLYLRNQVRLIADSAGEDAAILPKARGAYDPTLNLSDSRLRSVSRVHLAYLRNMGVRSSFSVAITVNGELWGLIAAHGHAARYVSHAVRGTCESVANTLSLFLPALETANVQRAALVFHDHLHALFDQLRASEDPREQLLRSMEAVQSLFGASGIALIEGTQVDFAGITPLRSDIIDIALLMRERMDKERRDVLAIESLAELYPQFETIREQTSGVLAVLAPELGGALFLLFRPELLRTVLWGGNPQKAVEGRNYEGPINPRVSFETWAETIRGHSAPWAPYEIKGSIYFRNLILDTLIRKERLLRELNARRAPAGPKS